MYNLSIVDNLTHFLRQVEAVLNHQVQENKTFLASVSNIVKPIKIGEEKL